MMLKNENFENAFICLDNFLKFWNFFFGPWGAALNPLRERHPSLPPWLRPTKFLAMSVEVAHKGHQMVLRTLQINGNLTALAIENVLW